MIRVRQIQKELGLRKAELNEILISLGEEVQKYYPNYRIGNEIAEKIRNHALAKKKFDGLKTENSKKQTVSEKEKDFSMNSNTILHDNNIIRKKDPKIAASSISKKTKIKDLNEAKLQLGIPIRSSKLDKITHKKLIVRKNTKKMNNRNSKKSNSVGNISSDSTAKVKRFKSVFINSNLSIVEILKNHENLALLEDFIALNDSWNEKTKITETIFLTYKSQLLNLYSRMDDQPKYKSKYKSYKNYGKIILGGRGG